MSFAAELILPPRTDEKRLEQAHRLNDGAMALRDAHAPSAVCLSVAKRALALMPGSPFIQTNLGLIYWDLGDLEMAREMFEAAIVGDPTNDRYHGNLGVFASATANTDLAERHLTEAIRLSDGKVGPKWDHALLQLWQGKWEQGFAEYDIRRYHHKEVYPGLPYPLWQGEDLNGKSIYVQGEQGTGDRILFSRYLAWLKERWPTCEIHAHLHDSLVNLMWEYETSGVVKRFYPDKVLWPPGIDYACFLLSLPQFHGTRPDFVPPDPGFIKSRTLRNAGILQMPKPELPSLKVGICWTGNPTQTRNADRSIPLELMIEFAEDPRIQLYSVQVGEGNRDLDRCGARKLIVDLGDEIEKEGWLGTAQVLMTFDVVVTVCTSIAHLAGTLDINCWTLLCKEPFWAWPRAGQTTPWYPNMRLFRQKQHGGWRPVIEEVKGELGRLADAKIGPA